MCHSQSVLKSHKRSASHSNNFSAYYFTTQPRLLHKQRRHKVNVFLLVRNRHKESSFDRFREEERSSVIPYVCSMVGTAANVNNSVGCVRK